MKERGERKVNAFGRRERLEARGAQRGARLLREARQRPRCRCGESRGRAGSEGQKARLAAAAADACTSQPALGGSLPI